MRVNLSESLKDEDQFRQTPNLWGLTLRNPSRMRVNLSDLLSTITPTPHRTNIKKMLGCQRKLVRRSSSVREKRKQRTRRPTTWGMITSTTPKLKMLVLQRKSTICDAASPNMSVKTTDQPCFHLRCVSQSDQASLATSHEGLRMEYSW